MCNSSIVDRDHPVQSAHRTSWDELTEIDSRLRSIEARARLYGGGQRIFAAWDHLRPQLARLVGAGAANLKLQSPEAYTAAVEHVQSILERRAMA